jgi:hypothetical protein
MRKIKGLIRVPRSIRKWSPVISFTGKSWRATVTHPKDTSIQGTALHEYPEVAIHSAQKHAVDVYNERRVLRHASSVTIQK